MDLIWPERCKKFMPISLHQIEGCIIRGFKFVLTEKFTNGCGLRHPELEGSGGGNFSRRSAVTSTAVISTQMPRATLSSNDIRAVFSSRAAS
jgi:hypothetical protein